MRPAKLQRPVTIIPGCVCLAMVLCGHPLAAELTSPLLEKSMTLQQSGEANRVDPSSRIERTARIQTLISQLGSDRYVEREAAEQELLKFGSLARLALERAVRYPDAEIAARARRLLNRLPELTHSVVDALGAPIPGATVTISVTRMDAAQASENEILVCESDELGRIPIPPLESSNTQAIVEVHHSDYGAARYEVGTHTSDTQLRLPLVRADSASRQRAVRGVVLGSEGLPVAGAVIRCPHVRTPGQGLVNCAHPCGDGLTDAEGHFVLYIPNENRDRERGELIPVNSTYELFITVPDDASLFPAAGTFSNLQSNSIVLSRAARLHRFRFQGPDGEWIEDSRQLQYIGIRFEGAETGENVRIPLERSVITEGRPLIPGRYAATGYFDGSSVDFLPVVVTHDSPEELIFRLPPALVFRGRIVHGVSGEPMVRAFVMGWSSTARSNLALLSADDWEQLRGVASNTSLDHPAVKLLAEHYGVKGLVRTDTEGRFEITQGPDEEFYGLMAFEEDFVPFKVRVFSLDTDSAGPVAAGDFPLFPAAKVLVRPVYEGQHLSVSPKWLISEIGQPDWIDQFHAATDEHQTREFEYVHWLSLNERQPVYVPGGVHLRLQFETPYDDQWAPARIDTPLVLEQGESHEIGDLRFAAALPAIVQVTDKNGEPLEGVPVRRKYDDDNSWCVAHNTDASGRAYFHVNPRSRGRFRASDIPAPGEVALAENVFAVFEIMDEAPPQPYQIILTDEQRQLLLEAPDRLK